MKINGYLHFWISIEEFYHVLKENNKNFVDSEFKFKIIGTIEENDIGILSEIDFKIKSLPLEPFHIFEPFYRLSCSHPHIFEPFCFHKHFP